MNLSLSRFKESLQRIAKLSPLSIVFLLCIYFLVLNGIRDWGIFDAYENREEATAVGAAMIAVSVLFVTSVNTSVSRFGGRKPGLLLGLVGMMGVWRRKIAPLPEGVEITELFVMGAVGVLGLVGISLIGTTRKDSAVHQWILQLIEQAIIAWLFTILLSGGISLALMAIRGLFGVLIDGERFATIRASCALFLGCVSFIDGVLTAQKESLGQDTVHKWKKMLSRVLGFLLLVFGVILYVYMAKILLTGQRPSNEVTFWAFLYSGIVIVSSIILLPIRQDDDARLYTIRRWMYLSILPMCVMIAVAIFLRVQQYGITVERYLVIAFLLRLFCASLMMVLRKQLRLWWLFISLISVAIFSVIARPLNARNISYQSQLDRAKNLLESTGALTESGLQLPLEVSSEDAREVSGVLTYIVYSLRKDLSDLDSRLIGTPREIFDQLDIAVASVRSGFFPNGGVKQIDTDNRRSFSNYGSTNGASIQGYSTLYQGLFVFNAGEVQEGERATLSGTNLEINVGGSSYQIDLESYIQELLLLPEDDRKGMVEPQDLSFENEQLKLLINNISLAEKDSVRRIENVDFDVLVK